MHNDLQKRIDNSIKELVEIKKEAGKNDLLKHAIIGVIDHLSKTLDSLDGDEDHSSKSDPIEYTNMKEAINHIMKKKKWSVVEVANMMDISRVCFYDFMKEYNGHRHSKTINKIKKFLGNEGYTF